MTKIAHGFRFLPTDDELIVKFLLKKVKGEPLSSEDVTDCEIYGDNDREPWKIFDETSSKKFYMITKLKKKGNGRRIERKAGCGTWKGQRTEAVKDSQNHHVGFKKAFVFEVKGSDSTNLNKGHWLMNEFSLPTNEIDYVLCEIRNKHPIDIIDDQQQQKRVRFSNAVEEEQNSFLGVATPAPISLALDEASMDFAAGSNSFIEAATTTSTFALNEALSYSAAPYEDGLIAKDLENFDVNQRITNVLLRDLLGAEDAKQVQISNELVPTTIDQEFRNRSLVQQQQSMVRYLLNNAIGDMSTSFKTAEEPVLISASASASALNFDAGVSASNSASALDINAGASTFMNFNAGYFLLSCRYS